ncbi:MAG: polyhydroxyalkanoate synthesis regulator DNA-binding domain-containing protein, partial [Limisphaerales bacterium]
MAIAAETRVKSIEIKKYPNRRYYDSTHSRHLTLDEIRSLIQKGHEITVTDAKTGEDITAQLLTQIILELDTAKLDSFPVPLLLRVIRVNDQLVKDFIDKYFNQALQSFLDYQRRIEDQMRHSGLTASFPGASAWTEAVFQPFAAAFGDAPPAPAFPVPPHARAEADGDLGKLVRELQQQVMELKREQKKA